jgi:hypothetical protein
MIGDVREAAIWFHVGAIERAMMDVRGVFDLDRGAGLDFNTIRWEILRPGEGAAPEMPDAPATLRLLVGRAKITKEPSRHSFIAELDRADLKRLRKLTREKHREQCPWARPMRDAEVDDVIEELGPESAEAVLRKIVSEGG